LTFVALSDRGLCALKMVGNRAGEREVLAELRRQFPGAELVRDARAVAPVLRQVNELIAGRRSNLDVPLDLHGTAFQQRVWRALCQVPRGQTWSYSELARRAGSPRAVRAAASACARNPVAILVPCHRIVREDGGLGGYRWGLERKRELLRRERDASSKRR
jgi:AraC family transcriptional regulator, regulatory protein of adaptative response / methylated-DNA-[protein]-cysteine methyltransferase